MKLSRPTGLSSLALAPRQTASSSERSDLAIVVAGATALALVVSALLFLAWVRAAQVRMGYEIHDLRSDVMRLRHERSELAIETQTLERPERLDAIAREKLSLFPPSARRVISWEDTLPDLASRGTLAGGAR